jgi:long-subunit acyl-CoA synthetase (AMP-forming)
VARIGILGKNSAGWIMADLAIWMAGYVSVPLYPLQSPTMSGRLPNTASLSPASSASSMRSTCSKA